MPEAGAYASLLAGAALAALAGMGWLALAMPVHAAQACGQSPAPPRLQLLRWLGGGGLLASLSLCLSADHVTMAVLVWVMLMAASALTVALLLAHRPRWLLRVLAPWLARERRSAAGRTH